MPNAGIRAVLLHSASNSVDCCWFFSQTTAWSTAPPASHYTESLRNAAPYASSAPPPCKRSPWSSSPMAPTPPHCATPPPTPHRSTWLSSRVSALVSVSVAPEIICVCITDIDWNHRVNEVPVRLTGRLLTTECCYLQVVLSCWSTSWNTCTGRKRRARYRTPRGTPCTTLCAERRPIWDRMSYRRLRRSSCATRYCG